MSVTYVRNPETGIFEQVGPGGATTDTTLSQAGKPADAAAVGAALTNYATEAYVNSETINKVDKVDGKGLSTNDYTDAEKTKLAGIATGANKYTLPTATSSVLGGVKTGSNITNSSGTISLTSANVTSALGFTPFDSSKVIPKTKGGAGRDMSDFPANAIIRNSGSGGSDLYYTATANGACYATEANGYPKFGTLPVAQGGTGKTVAWTNGTVSSLNSTTVTSAQFATFLREDAVNSKRDFTFETVLSSPRNVELLKKAKAAGYKIEVVFVLTADPQINVSRVAQRVKNGGHDVPRDKIISRYYKSLNNLSKMLPNGMDVVKKIYRKAILELFEKNNK